MAAVVPQKAQYWANMVEWATYVRQNVQASLALGTGAGNDAALSQNYYDGQKCAYRVRDYTGDGTTHDAFIAACFDAYCLRYVIPANGAVQGFRQFAQGPLEDVLRSTTRISQAINSITLMKDNAAFLNLGDLTNEDLSRECALGLITFISAQRAGISLSGAQITRRGVLLNYAIGHIDRWVAGTADYFRPFMGAHTARALIDYYNFVDKDSRIVPKLRALIDYTRSSCWRANAGSWGVGQSFSYTNINTATLPVNHPAYNTGGIETAPDLNMFIVPPFAFLWWLTGEQKYRTWGDEAFLGAISVYSGASYISGAFLGTRSNVNPSGKQYNQQLIWGPEYIDYAERDPFQEPGTPQPIVLPASAARTYAKLVSGFNLEQVGSSVGGGVPATTIGTITFTSGGIFHYARASTAIAASRAAIISSTGDASPFTSEQLGTSAKAVGVAISNLKSGDCGWFWRGLGSAYASVEENTPAGTQLTSTISAGVVGVGGRVIAGLVSTELAVAGIATRVSAATILTVNTQAAIANPSISPASFFTGGVPGPYLYPGNIVNNRNAAGNQAINGEAVATVNDSGAGGINVTQSTNADRPTLVTAALNGLAVLQSDGSDRLVGTALNAFFDGASSVTIICVLRPTNGGASHNIFRNWDSGFLQSKIVVRLNGLRPEINYNPNAVNNGNTRLAAGDLTLNAYNAVIFEIDAANRTTACYANNATALATAVVTGPAQNFATGTAGSEFLFGVEGQTAYTAVWKNALMTSGQRASLFAALKSNFNLTTY